MSNYYKECIEEIENMINTGDYESASIKVKEELSMPYIPKDFEEKFFEGCCVSHVFI